MTKVSGRLCIKFEVDTEKFKRDHISFLYNIADGVIKLLDEYHEGIHFSIGEDDFVELN